MPVVREQSDRLRKLAFMHEARQLCFGIEESFHSWDFFSRDFVSYDAPSTAFF